MSFPSFLEHHGLPILSFQPARLPDNGGLQETKLSRFAGKLFSYINMEMLKVKDHSRWGPF